MKSILRHRNGIVVTKRQNNFFDAKHVACKKKTRNPYTVLVGKSEGKKSLGKINTEKSIM
jgi:hypothetical protein